MSQSDQNKETMTPVPDASAFRLSSNKMVDTGRVRLGGQSPIMRIIPAITDNGKVRLGGQGPVFRT